MLRNKLRAWRKLAKTVSVLLWYEDDCKLNKSILLRNILFFYYLQEQKIFDNLAQTFYQKKAFNPKPQPWVNTCYTPNAKEINHKKFSCQADINYHDIDYVHQPRIFDCADACMEMLANYHLKKAGELTNLENVEHIKNFAANLFKMEINLFSGMDTEEFKNYSNRIIVVNFSKLKKNMSIAEFAYHLYEKGPIIVNTNELGGHFIIVKGVVNGQVIVHDPWSGPNLAYPYTSFIKYWDDYLVYFAGGYSKSIKAEDTHKPSESIKAEDSHKPLVI